MPGYRVDVAVLLHVESLSEIVPSVPPVDLGAVRLSAIAELAAEIVSAPVTVHDVTVELRAAAAGSAELTVDPVVVHELAVELTATAELRAALDVVPGVVWTPADLVELDSWYTAEAPETTDDRRRSGLPMGADQGAGQRSRRSRPSRRRNLRSASSTAARRSRLVPASVCSSPHGRPRRPAAWSIVYRLR